MSDFRKLTLQIEGMRCSGCAAAVEKVLKNVSGVQEVLVDATSHIATLTTNSNVSLPSILSALQAANYPAKIMNTNEVN